MADLSVLMPIATGVGIFFVILMGMAVLFKSFYIKVSQGTALIVNDGKTAVELTGDPTSPVQWTTLGIQDQ